MPNALSDIPGQLIPGNIDLNNRPVVHNPDGSISTVRSITITDNYGRVILIPTVVGNRVVSNDEAIRHYQQTGEHLGVFGNLAAANAYAQHLHEDQAKQYLPKPQSGANSANLQTAAATQAGSNPDLLNLLAATRPDPSLINRNPMQGIKLNPGQRVVDPELGVLSKRDVRGI